MYFLERDIREREEDIFLFFNSYYKFENFKQNYWSRHVTEVCLDHTVL